MANTGTNADTIIEARRAYKREWARRNPEKVKQYQERFWAKKAAEMQLQEAARSDSDK